MFSIVRTLSLGATLIVPLVLSGCPPEGNEPSTGGTGGEPSEETSVESLCDRLDECNQLTGISAVECTDITNFCLDENFSTQSLKDDWALFVEGCLDFSTCGVFVDCALDVADATGCPPFYTEPVDLQGTIEELCDELDFCGKLGESTIPQCIDFTYDCLDVEYPTTTDEWVDAVQNCYDTTPDCLDYVNCLIDDADCPYFDGAGGSGGDGGSGGTGGEAGNGGAGGACGTEITCYPDSDRDGWPAATGALATCDTCPVNFVTALDAFDCDDGNMDVYPGNQMFYSSCRPCGMECCAGNDAFDYNCDGVSERKYPVRTTCPSDCRGIDGFLADTIPDCGELGDLHRCYVDAGGLCNYSGPAWSSQACR